MSLQTVFGEIDLKKLSGGEIPVVPFGEGQGMYPGGCVVTGSFGTGAEYIIRITVPEKSRGYTAEDLKTCYDRCLREFFRLCGKDRKGGTLLPVLGSGEPGGWTERESLEAAWHSAAVFLFNRLWPPVRCAVRIYCRDLPLTEEYNRRKSRAFYPVPEDWQGTRGNLQYWKYLMKHFDSSGYNELDLYGFIREISQITEALCGCGVSEELNAYVETLDHGGMSGGAVSGFWALHGIPLLCSRLCQMGLDGIKKKHMVSVSVRKETCPENDVLFLPKEILPELQSFLTRSTLKVSPLRWKEKPFWKN